MLSIEVTPEGETLPVAVIQEVWRMMEQYADCVSTQEDHKTVQDWAGEWEHAHVTVGCSEVEQQELKETHEGIVGTPVAVWYSGESMGCSQVLFYRPSAPGGAGLAKFYWTEP